MPYQYGNQANPVAHYNGTALEILEELDEISAFVAGLGTGGTLMGNGRRLKEELGDGVKIVAAEPMQGEPVQGLRSLDDGFIPPIIDLSLLDRKIFVTNRDAIVWTRKLLDEEGIFAGVSSGAIASIAVRIANELDEGNVVFIVCDDGWKYLSSRHLHAAGRRDREPRLHRVVVNPEGIADAPWSNVGHGTDHRPRDRPDRPRPEAPARGRPLHRQGHARVQGLAQRHRRRRRRRGRRRARRDRATATRPPRSSPQCGSPRELLDRIVAHARAEAPNECCGMHRARATARRSCWSTAENARRSPLRYEIDGLELLRIQTRSRTPGSSSARSTTRTRAPRRCRRRPTSTSRSIPSALYVIVGLAGGEPDVRAWRIVDGEVSQAELEVEVSRALRLPGVRDAARRPTERFCPTAACRSCTPAPRSARR